jgi:hypothetical protein
LGVLKGFGYPAPPLQYLTAAVRAVPGAAGGFGFDLREAQQDNSHGEDVSVQVRSVFRAVGSPSWLKTVRDFVLTIAKPSPSVYEGLIQVVVKFRAKKFK